MSALDELHRSDFLSDEEFLAGLMIQHHHWTTLVKGDPLAPPTGCRFAPRLSKIMARQELDKASSRVGFFLWPILFAACAEEESVTAIESRFELPRRSAKVAIKAGLSVLAADPATFATLGVIEVSLAA